MVSKLTSTSSTYCQSLDFCFLLLLFLWFFFPNKSFILFLFFYAKIWYCPKFAEVFFNICLWLLSLVLLPSIVWHLKRPNCNHRPFWRYYSLSLSLCIFCNKFFISFQYTDMNLSNLYIWIVINQIRIELAQYEIAVKQAHHMGLNLNVGKAKSVHFYS